MRTRFLVFAAALSLVGACGDARLTTDASSGFANQLSVPNGPLEAEIFSIFQLYPAGIATAEEHRWSTVKRALESGNLAQAKNLLVSLSKFVIEKAPVMSQPAGGETRSAAAARLVLYMSLYVYEGAGTTPPPYASGIDNAVGIVTPTEGGLVVTPSTNAGVSVPVGAVDENTIVVITHNLTPYPTNCSGPLPTNLCQYPAFYHFAQFPHKRLNVGAKFAVCHVNHGTNRRLLNDIDHDRLRLAHQLPTVPSPGATVVDGIEILPFVTQTFSECEDVEYALNEPTGLDLVLARATSAITQFLTPKNAWAIDQGGGGMGFEFSDFNNVDPEGAPDDSIGTVMTTFPTGNMSVYYVIRNVGTATSPAGRFMSFTFTPFATTHVPTPVPWASPIGVAAIAPGDSIVMTTTAPDPGSSGTLTLSLGSSPLLGDSNMANNVKTVTIGSVILKKGKRP